MTPLRTRVATHTSECDHSTPIELPIARAGWKQQHKIWLHCSIFISARPGGICLLPACNVMPLHCIVGHMCTLTMLIHDQVVYDYSHGEK